MTIATKNITKKFGSVVAVDNVNLSIGKEFLSILGSSGSGKTTLLRLLAGLETPSEGHVIFGDKDVTELPPNLRGVGMVFQNFLLFPHKTVAENVVFPLRMQKISKSEQKERLGWMLELIKIDPYKDRFPNQLSGGQQQRVALARGLISRPELLLLDEPLANLDRELRKEMEVEIRRYQKELDIPFVYVTHNQEEALAMSDRIAVMSNGRFDQVASRSEIYNNPATKFVATFVGQSNHLVGKLSNSRLNWSGHKLIAPSPKGHSDGDTVECFIKCEHMSIDKTAPSNEKLNVVVGTVQNIIFKGQTVDYFIRTGYGDELIVNISSQNDILPQGDEVYVSWDPSRSHCFPV